MFGPSAIFLIATAFRKVAAYIDSGNNASVVCKSNKTTLNCSALPCLKRVTVCNTFINGDIIECYRKYVTNSCCACIAPSKAFITITRHDDCNLLNEEKFIRGAIATIQRRTPDVGCVNERSTEIIKIIFKCSTKLQFCEQDLLNFTAIAMHNMFKFTKLTVACNATDPHLCRGLLQVKGMERLNEMATSVHKLPGDYSFLDRYDETSIYAEMLWYKKRFAGLQFSEVVIQMGSSESSVLTQQSDSIYFCNEATLEKLRRRFTIFTTLAVSCDISKPIAALN
ncbi:hypothetical protein ENBRE01_0651 [Enteropsectra breve]|nr:hypothetical protein ENBRE01_0651 [Enteropsectra breve]